LHSDVDPIRRDQQVTAEAADAPVRSGGGGMMIRNDGRRLRIALGMLLVSALAFAVAGCASGAGNGSQTTLGAGSTVIGPTASAGSTDTTASPSAAGSTDTTGSPSTTEAAVAVENNPPGDIPDNQAFVAYKAPGGFTVKIPEGWARVEGSSSTSFTDKLNTIVLSWAPADAAPTTQSVQATDIPALQNSVKAFEFVKLSLAKLPAGAAVLVTYRANSEPNAVTGKQYRLDELRYSLFHQGQRLDITLSSPVGADNVDPWNTVMRSVTW
jgi:hypothetical protein